MPPAVSGQIRDGSNGRFHHMYQDDIDCAGVQGCNLVIRNNKYGNLRQSANRAMECHQLSLDR